MRLLAHCDFGGVGESHPHRNFQSLAYRIYHRDCTVSPFRSPRNSQAIAVQRMKRIENADVRGNCTQGIVGGCISIRTCIASCPAAASPPMAAAGSLVGRILSSFLIKSSAASSANYFCSLWEGLFAKVVFTSPASFAIWLSRPRSSPCVRQPQGSNGSFTLSLPSADLGAY